jgi:outer membrane protein TolC
MAVSVKNVLSAIAIFAAAHASLYSQLTLKGAVEKALAKNNGIKSYQKTLESKDEQVSVSWGRFAPSIAFDATYTHLDDPLTMSLNPIRDAMIQLQTGDQVALSNLENLIKTGKALTPEQQLAVKNGAMGKLNKALPEFKSTLKQQNYPSAKVTLTQPIFTGGKIIAGVDAAKAQKEMAEVKLTSEKEALTSSVISYYLTVMLAKENVKVRQSVYEGVKKHADRAEKLMLQGVIANNDKLRADVALAEAERNLFDATEKFNIAVTALNSVLEEKPETRQEFFESLKFVENDFKLDELINLAKSDNTTLQSLKSANKALDAKTDSKYAEYLPTVYGFGSFNFFQGYLSALEPNWAVGVGVKYQLFDGFQRTNEYESSKAESESLEFMRLDAERKIELLIRSQYMNMKLAKDNYLKLEKTVTQAEENLKLNEKRFEEGLGTSLEALDAQLALEGVMLKRYAAINDYYQNLASLLQSGGQTQKFIDFWTNNIK